MYIWDSLAGLCMGYGTQVTIKAWKPLVYYTMNKNPDVMFVG